MQGDVSSPPCGGRSGGGVPIEKRQGRHPHPSPPPGRGTFRPSCCGRAWPTDVLVRSEIDVPVVSLELHELEVTEPRTDFNEEVVAAEARARAGHVGDIGPARALYRR